MAHDAGASADAGQGDAGQAASGSTIAGSVKGKAFSTAATALWIGSPDDPATTVVYVFSNAVTCDQISSPGWDTRIADGTQVLEMKMIGTTPATYPVATGPTAANGEAAVNYTLSSTTNTPGEQIASGGQVVLSTREDQARATGTFMIDFGTGHVAGTYDASYCAAGTEP